MSVDADILAVYAECIARLRNSECMAAPIPRSLEVRIALERRRVVCSKFDVIEACARLRLTLADV